MYLTIDRCIMHRLLLMLDQNELIEHIKESSWIDRYIVAILGTDSHRSLLLSMDEDDRDVRAMIARYGNDDHRDILISAIIKEFELNPNGTSYDDEVVLNIAICGNDYHRKLLYPIIHYNDYTIHNEFSTLYNRLK